MRATVVEREGGGGVAGDRRLRANKLGRNRRTRELAVRRPRRARIRYRRSAGPSRQLIGASPPSPCSIAPAIVMALPTANTGVPGRCPQHLTLKPDSPQSRKGPADRGIERKCVWREPIEPSRRVSRSGRLVSSRPQDVGSIKGIPGRLT